MQFINLKHKLLNNKKRLGMIFLLIILSLGLIFVLKLTKKQRLTEVFEITGPNQAYFELETDKTSLDLGEEVEIKIRLAVSANQEFDLALAVVEWDESKLEYVNAVGNLSGNFASSFIQGDQGRRIMTHFIPQGDPLLSNPTDEPIDFATLTLRAIEDRPVTIVGFSLQSDDLEVRFDNLPDVNAVDRSLADQNKLVVVFGTIEGCDVCCGGLTAVSRFTDSGCSSLETFVCVDTSECGDGVCDSSAGEDHCNCDQDCPLEASPSPGTSPSPLWQTLINLEIKFDGVPANNNDMNLPGEHRRQKVTVIVEDARDGNMVYQGEVDFDYMGSEIWEGSLGW